MTVNYGIVFLVVDSLIPGQNKMYFPGKFDPWPKQSPQVLWAIDPIWYAHVYIAALFVFSIEEPEVYDRNIADSNLNASCWKKILNFVSYLTAVLP